MNLAEENKLRGDADYCRGSHGTKRNQHRSAGWNTLKDMVSENVTSLKELVLTPPRTKMAFRQDDLSCGKRSRSLFETPNPDWSDSGPSSKTAHALWSPPKLKKTIFRDTLEGSDLFDIVDRFPTLDNENGEDRHRDGNLPFVRRLKKKPLIARKELPFSIPETIRSEEAR
jgi:hypothetical protein